MKNLLLPCVLLVSTSSVFAQTVYVGTDAVTGKSVTPWVAKSPAEYAGSYHFGFSECESSFDLAIKNGIATASKEYTDMSNAAKMHNVKKPFTHVRIAGSRFFSDQAVGEFVYYTEGKKRYRALKINSSWSCSQPKNTTEVGVRNNSQVNSTLQWYGPGANLPTSSTGSYDGVGTRDRPRRMHAPLT